MRLIVGLLSVWLIVTAAAQPVVIKHSGTILAIDTDMTTIVLAEVGPWRVERGVTQITRRTIALTPKTEVVRVLREEQGVEYPGGFVEVRVEARALKIGQFVTVECQHEGKRLTALKITVPELTG